MTAPGAPAIAAIPAFVDSLLARLAERDIDASAMPISHLCWRTASPEAYRVAAAAFRPFASETAEDEFAGRPITLMLLRDPVSIGSRRAALIEICAPRAGHPYPEGWEHAGFSLGGDPLAFHAANAAALDGIKDRGMDVQSAYVTFADGATAKFYASPLREIVARQEGRWPFAPVTATGARP
jgi:predicted metalloenzyme YecM